MLSFICNFWYMFNSVSSQRKIPRYFSMETNGTWLPVCCTSQYCTEFLSPRINPQVFGLLWIVTEWCISLLQLPAAMVWSPDYFIKNLPDVCFTSLVTTYGRDPVCNHTLPLPDSSRDGEVFPFPGDLTFLCSLERETLRRTLWARANS